MLLMVALAVLPAGSAAAVTERPSPRVAEVSVMSTAQLVSGGDALTTTLRLRCEPVPGIQWEGFVNAEQGDVFAWAELSLVCDGRWHTQSVTLPVSAPPDTAWFVPGRATVSVFLIDENTLTEYARDVRSVRVVGSAV